MKPIVGPVMGAPGLARWFLATAAATWVLICLGALVRAKQAGLACPDWPLCHGAVVPNLHIEGVPWEYGHRVLAGLVSIAFAVGLLQARRLPGVWRHVRRQMLGGAALLATQVVFGGLTVLIVHKGDGAPRPEWWPVVIHLLLGNGFAALMVWVGLDVRALGLQAVAPSLPIAAPPPSVRTILTMWTGLLLLQFVLGGAVSSHVIGLICAEFPTCNEGEWFPAWTGYVGLQVFHRLTAYALVGCALALAWVARADARARTPTRGLAWLMLVQVGIGAANVLSLVHTIVTTAHSAVAALLFTGTVLCWRAGATRRP
ncbi:MAG: hypothetical protein EXR79_13700 [Myxococcales bacterium]|nr:hypothetical protein [Myxococcales bacterium]